MYITKYVPGQELKLGQEVKGYKRTEYDRPQMFLGRIVNLTERNVCVMKYGKNLVCLSIDGFYKIQIAEETAKVIFRNKVSEIVSALDTAVCDDIGQTDGEPDDIFVYACDSILEVAARLEEIDCRLLGVCEAENIEDGKVLLVYEDNRCIRHNTPIDINLFLGYYDEGQAMLS